ncbi:MAG TPA: DUF4383 domain-containing protein [Candidatus Competibacteraceae bacterium]|nr:DUF4383 domain-containing protein [Candidatus Competibacteraceae bacterium]
MNVKTFALVLGIIYLAVGVLGFIPALLSPPGPGAPGVAVTAGYGYLLGLFPVNILHTLVHLAVGVWGVFAQKDFDSARTFARGVAILYAVLTIFGLIPGLHTVFGLVPLFGHDIWLHALTAIAAGYFGFVAAPDGDYARTATTARR